MKNLIRKFICAAMLLSVPVLFSGCGGNASSSQASKAESTDALSVSAESTGHYLIDVTEEDVVEAMQYYKEDAEEIEQGKDVPLELEANTEDGGCLHIYKFYAEETGVYSVNLSNISQIKDVFFYSLAFDDYSNILMSMTNLDPETYDFMVGVDELSQKMDCIAGLDYYIAVNSYPEDESTPLEGSVSLRIDNTGEPIEASEQKDAEEVYYISAESYQIVQYDPKETGYYYVDASLEEGVSGSGAIYAVLKDGEEDVYGGSGICRMEKGSSYYIIFSADNADTEDVAVSLYCDLIPTAETKGLDTLTIEKDLIVIYTAEQDGDIVAYSVSDGDPSVEIFDEAYDEIAANNSGDGVLSDNEDDFAALMSVEKGKEYYLKITGTGNKPCEVHFVDYDTLTFE